MNNGARPPVSVILTCAVDPHVQVVRSHPMMRLADYRKSFERWSRLLAEGDQLVLVDNTGFAVESILPKEPVSTITVVRVDEPNGYSILRGKGYLETLMLESGISVAQHDLVFKSTGRLVVSNFPALADDCRSSPPAFVSARLRFDLQFADSRFYCGDAVTMAIVASHLKRWVDERVGVWAEHALARSVLQVQANGQAAFSRFQRSPRVRGMSGTTGAQYGGPAWALRRMVEDRFRRFSGSSSAPWV